MFKNQMIYTTQSMHKETSATMTIIVSLECFDQIGTAQEQCHCPTECEYNRYQVQLSTGYFPAKTTMLSSTSWVCKLGRDVCHMHFDVSKRRCHNV